MVCCNALFGSEAEKRLHWEEVLLEEEKGVSETLQQRQAVHVCPSRVVCDMRTVTNPAAPPLRPSPPWFHGSRPCSRPTHARAA